MWCYMLLLLHCAICSYLSSVCNLFGPAGHDCDIYTFVLLLYGSWILDGMNKIVYFLKSIKIYLIPYLGLYKIVIVGMYVRF
jgi:hypothetical protein